jgi:opacity protein-like surface antigen
MSLTRSLGLTILIGLVTAAPARADGMIIPFFGANFGGNSGKELASAVNANRIDWGVSFAFMAGGVVGLEADIGQSPDFYGKTSVGKSSVLTATGNFLIGVPIGGQKGFGFRPYFLAGVGVIRSNLDAFGNSSGVDTNSAAWDIGGGAMFFFSNHVGLRGDLRYFRTFNSVDFGPIDVTLGPRHINFARASAGLVLRF